MGDGFGLRWRPGVVLSSGVGLAVALLAVSFLIQQFLSAKKPS